MPAKRLVGHYKTLSSQIPKTRWLIFDTETNVVKDDKGNYSFPFRLGVAIYLELDNMGIEKKRIVYRFDCVSDFFSLLEKHSIKKNKLFIIAHNIGFDLRVLDIFNYFYKQNALSGNDIYTSEPPIINNRVFMWTVKANGCNLCFIDTANYGVLSVEQLGKTFGFEKMSVDFTTVTDDNLYEYCQRDVEILERFIKSYVSFLAGNRLGDIKFTLASQSLTAFRTRFMLDRPYVHDNDFILDLERKAYHGGRVECYRIGEFNTETYYGLDVNSMYPAAMLSGFFPGKLLTSHKDIPVRRLKVNTSLWYCIADVIVDTQEPVYSYKKSGKLIFPIGRFRTVLHQDELVYALGRNHIREVKYVAVYERIQPFNAYIDFFYNVKVQSEKDGNMAWRYIAKLFLNSLYGKFGEQQNHRSLFDTIGFDDIYRVTAVNIDTGERFSELCWYGDVYRESRYGETLLSIPAIAGAVTAKARMILYNFIQKAGIKNVYYCDTDSLIVNSLGLERLLEDISSTKIGMLKLEKQTNNMKIYNAKDYSFGDIVHIKGIPPKAIPLSQDSWLCTQFEGFLSWLNNGAKEPPKAKEIIKRRVSAYNKGFVDTEGFVHPFTVFEP